MMGVAANEGGIMLHEHERHATIQRVAGGIGQGQSWRSVVVGAGLSREPSRVSPSPGFLSCTLHRFEIPHSAFISDLASPYQIRARSASGLTIASPSLHPHAALNSGMLLNGPFTRHIDGACSLEFTCVRSA